MENQLNVFHDKGKRALYQGGEELLLQFPDSNVNVMGRRKNVGFLESNNTLQCITIFVTAHALPDRLLVFLLFIWFFDLWQDNLLSASLLFNVVLLLRLWL